MLRSVPPRLAASREYPSKLAPLRSPSKPRFRLPARQLFHALTPCLRLSRCSWFDIPLRYSHFRRLCIWIRQVRSCLGVLEGLSSTRTRAGRAFQTKSWTLKPIATPKVQPAPPDAKMPLAGQGTRDHS